MEDGISDGENTRAVMVVRKRVGWAAAEIEAAGGG